MFIKENRYLSFDKPKQINFKFILKYLLSIVFRMFYGILFLIIRVPRSNFKYNVSWCGPLWIELVGNFLCFLNLNVSFSRLGKFSATVASNKFSAPFSLASPYEVLIMQMLICFCYPRGLLNCPHFKNSFLFSLTDFHYSVI